ncbi:hypothetical protein NQZ68_007580, partial [Dissostichus eleginoides]
ETENVDRLIKKCLLDTFRQTDEDFLRKASRKMATPKKILVSILEYLGKEDFKKFKWYLQEVKYQHIQGIPKSRLEDADRMDTVDQMFLNYCINTFKVTIMVLGEIKQNKLKEELSKHPSEPA